MKEPLKLTTRQGERIAVVAGLRTPLPSRPLPFTACLRWIWANWW